MRMPEACPDQVYPVTKKRRETIARRQRGRASCLQEKPGGICSTSSTLCLKSRAASHDETRMAMKNCESSSSSRMVENR